LHEHRRGKGKKKKKENSAILLWHAGIFQELLKEKKEKRAKQPVFNRNGRPTGKEKGGNLTFFAPVLTQAYIGCEERGESASSQLPGVKW